MKIIKKKLDFNLDRAEFQYLLNFIGKKEKKKILKYKRYEDSLRSLYGKLILKDMLNLDKIELEYNEWGKPKLLNSKIHFNISHSGEWVAVGIATHSIGIDIQKIHEIDLSIANSFFSKIENEECQLSIERVEKDYFMATCMLKE